MEEEDPLSFISEQSRCPAMVEELLKRLPYARQQEEQDGVPPVVRVQEPPNGPPSTTGTEVGESSRSGDIAEEDPGARRRLLPLWARVNQDRLTAQRANQTETKRGDDIITIILELTREARSQLGLDDDDDDGATGDFLETAMRRGVTFTKSPT